MTGRWFDSRCAVAAITLAALAAAPLAARDLWDELGDENSQWALEQARARLAEALADEGNTDLVPDGPDGSDLPWLKWVLKEAVEADWKTVTEHAAELSRGELHGALADTYRWTRNEAVAATRKALLERLDTKTLHGKALELLTADGERLTRVADALFDPKQSWSEVATLAYDEAKDAARNALPGEIKKLAARGIHFALTGDAAGTAAGDLFFEVVAAEQQLLDAAERQLLLASGNRIYAAYREARGRDLSPDEAMVEIEPLLVRGVGGNLDLADGGALFERSFGGRAGTLAALETCHARKEPDFYWCLVESLRQLDRSLASATRQDVAAAGEVTRVNLERLWRAIGVELARAAERALGRREDLAERLATDLATATTDLGRLREAAAAADDLCREHTEHRESLAELAAALSAAEAESAALESDLAALTDCRSAPPPPAPAASSGDTATAAVGAMSALVAELAAAEAAAGAASNEACAFAPPTDLAAAEAAVRRAVAATTRTRDAVARGRARHAELESRARSAASAPAAALAPPADPLAPARVRVRSALAGLERTQGIAGTWRAVVERLRELTARATRLGYLASERRAVVEAKLLPWRGTASADAALAEAAQLESRILDCSGSARGELDQLDAPGRRLASESDAQVVAARLDRARSALARCAEPAPAAESGASVSAAAERAATLLAEGRVRADRLDAHLGAAELCLAAALAAVDRLRSPAPSSPPPSAASGAAGGGWVGGVAISVTSGGGPTPPAAPSAGGSSGALDPIVALASPEQCRYVEALGLAEQLAARLAPESAEGRWLAGQLPDLRRLAQDQRVASQSLAQALAAARGNDPRAARAALKIAKRRALGCQIPAIDQVDDQLAQAEEARRQADRAAFADAMAGLLPTLIDTYNRGVAPPPPPTPVATASASSGGGCGDPNAAPFLYAGMDWQTNEFRCTCAGYIFDRRLGHCVLSATPPAAGSVATGGGEEPVATGGGEWAIVRVDRRWSESAAFCGGATTVAVVERNITLYVRGVRDQALAAWQEVVRREQGQPGLWAKSGPCTCRKAGSGAVSVHRDNLSHEQALAVWENEIKRLPGSEVDFGVWEVPAAGDNARSSIDAAQLCNLRG